MVQVNEDGQVIGGNKVAVNAAGFMIHSAVHRARPDIHAACHTHSPAGKAWSTFGRPLDIINQDSCNFYGIQSVYNSFGGVVLEAEEGERVAASLGDKGRVAILQNHGLLTAGSTVDEAAYLFTSMERTCEVQLMVESTGLEKNFIGDKEAEFTARVNADPVRTTYLFILSSVTRLMLSVISRKPYTMNSNRTLNMRFGSPRASYPRVSNCLQGRRISFILYHVIRVHGFNENS